MSTFMLVLIWAGLGLIVGLLAIMARFKALVRRPYSRRWLLVLGPGSAVVGGLLGFWLFGRLFSPATALWIAVLATCAPAAYVELRKRLAGRW